MGKTYRGLNRFLIAVAIFATSFHINSVEAKSCSGFFQHGQLSPYLYSTKSLRLNSRLKVVTWNLLNFRISDDFTKPNSNSYKERFSEKYDTGHLKTKGNGFDKSPNELRKIGKIMRELNADIFVFQEVLNQESLAYFFRTYMNNEYTVALERGNDARGIQIAFAYKKSLNVDAEIRSHKNVLFRNMHLETPAVMPVFSRDLPALYLRQKDGSNARAGADPDLIILGTHFKSKRDSEGDPESIQIRSIQAQKASEIVQKIDAENNYKVPIILTGDFNADVSKSQEMAPIRSSLKNSLDMMGNKIPNDQKVTHTFHPYSGGVVPGKYDAQYLNRAMEAKFVSSSVYHYKDSSGREKLYRSPTGEVKPYPATHEQREQNSSDHNPVEAIYDMTR